MMNSIDLPFVPSVICYSLLLTGTKQTAAVKKKKKTDWRLVMMSCAGFPVSFGLLLGEYYNHESPRNNYNIRIKKEKENYNSKEEDLPAIRNDFLFH